MGGYSVNWHVPIDDTHHWKYTFMYSTPATRSVWRHCAGRSAQMGADYRPLNNRANRYNQDRASMGHEGYCGLGLNFQVQDLCVTEGMGPIMDRTKEHLTSMDRPMVAARKLLLKSIRDLEEKAASRRMSFAMTRDRIRFDSLPARISCPSPSRGRNTFVRKFSAHESSRRRP